MCVLGSVQVVYSSFVFLALDTSNAALVVEKSLADSTAPVEEGGCLHQQRGDYADEWAAHLTSPRSPRLTLAMRFIVAGRSVPRRVSWPGPLSWAATTSM